MGVCSRCTMCRNRHVRGVFKIDEDMESPNEGACLRYIMKWCVSSGAKALHMSTKQSMQPPPNASTTSEGGAEQANHCV